MINITSGVVSLVALVLVVTAIVIAFFSSKVVKKYGLAARIAVGTITFYIVLRMFFALWENL